MLIEAHFLRMLALGEGHLLHSTTMLVRKDDEQIAPVMIHAQFREQAFLSILIRHRTLACRNYHQKLVLSHTACQLREGTPMLHLTVRSPYTWVAVSDKRLYQPHRILTGMKRSMAVEVARESAQPFQPTIESGLKLCTARHDDRNMAQSTERSGDLCHQNLTVEPGERTLVKLAPRTM